MGAIVSNPLLGSKSVRAASFDPKIQELARLADKRIEAEEPQLPKLRPAKETQ